MKTKRAKKMKRGTALTTHDLMKGFSDIVEIEPPCLLAYKRKVGLSASEKVCIKWK